MAEYRVAGGRNRPGGVGAPGPAGAKPPGDYGSHPDGIDPETTAASGPRRAANGGGTVAPDYTWQEAIRTRAFWLITMGHASSSIIIISVMFYLGLLMVERGFGLGQIGGVISAQTAVSTAFILVGGLIGDRVPIRLAIFGFSFLQSIAMVVLLTAETLPMFYVFTVLMGIGFGGRTPLTTAIRGVYFRAQQLRPHHRHFDDPHEHHVHRGGALRRVDAGVHHGELHAAAASIAAVSAVGSIMFLFLGNPRLSPSQRRRADVQRLVTQGASTGSGA